MTIAEQTPAPSVSRMPWLPALGLLVLTLLAFAIISPLNSAGGDDWIYPFYGKLRSLTVFGSNRQFGLLPTVLTEILTPGRMVYGLLAFEVASVFGAALALYYLLRRLLPAYAWFALLFAAVYILYIPTNGDQARAMYSASVATWVVLMGTAAVLLLVEHFFHASIWRWLGILAAGVLAYMTVRAYESVIPIMLCVPLLLIFKRREIPLRRLLVSLLIWYAGVGLGIWQFIQSFLSQSSATVYQSTFVDAQPTSVSGILSDTLQFYVNSFPVNAFFNLPASANNYLLPGILVGLAAVMLLILFRRQYPAQTYLPPPRVLLLLVLIGLAEIGLASVAFAYAHIADTPRAQFFAAPGQALLLLGVVGLGVSALEQLLSLRAVHLLTVFLFIYSVNGASWYYQAQQYAMVDSPQFDTTLRFFREVVALVPNAQPDTLILYDCDTPDAYQWRLIDAMAAIYLYDDGVRIGVPEQVTWLPDKMHYQFIEWLDPRATYTYDQLILIGCANGHLYIMDTFPAERLPTGVGQVAYNPFPRIVNGFIPPERGRILGYS